METPEQVKLLEKACDSLAQEPKMRFVGIINKMGRVIAERYRDGVSSLLQDKEEKMISMELALEIFLREEFDEKLGTIDYVLSKRKKVNLISIPVSNYLILISTDPGINVDVIAQKSTSIFKEILK